MSTTSSTEAASVAGEQFLFEKLFGKFGGMARILVPSSVVQLDSLISVEVDAIFEFRVISF